MPLISHLSVSNVLTISIKQIKLGAIYKTSCGGEIPVCVKDVERLMVEYPPRGNELPLCVEDVKTRLIAFWSGTIGILVSLGGKR